MGTLKNRCVIIGGGDCSAGILKAHITLNDYVICADGGYDTAIKSDISPDLLIGDFDSINAIPENVRRIILPVEKDVTDSVAAFNEGVKQGYNKFVLFGGTGGRNEHTLANISLMANASRKGIDFTIIDEKHIFRSITNSSVKIKKRENQQISVFAYGNIADGVTLKGLYYPLNDFSLDPFDGALGTSNHIVDEYGEITVKKGTLVIIETQV